MILAPKVKAAPAATEFTAPTNCAAIARLFGVWTGRFFCFNGLAGDGFSIPKGHSR